MRRIPIACLRPSLVAVLGVALGGGVVSASDLRLDQPLSADECVRIALQNSDQLAQARAGELAQHGSYLSSYSGVLPSISGGASWSRMFTPSFPLLLYSDPATDSLGNTTYTETTVLVDTTTYSGSLDLDVSQSLLDLGAIYNLRERRQTLKAYGADVSATESEIGLAVRQQFYVCVASTRLAEVEAHATQLARDQLHRSETLFQLGSVARSDVLQAQVNLADAEQTATRRRNAVPLEIGRLALTMGLDPRTGVVVDTSIVAPAEDPPEGLDAYVQGALQRRPDLAAARARLRAAEFGETSARMARLPTLRAGTGWTRSASRGTGVGLGDADYSNSWRVGLNASMTLFSGLQIEGAIQSAHGGRLSQEQALELQEKNVTLEVQEAYLGIFNAREVLRAAVTGVSLAQENLRLQQALYESGAGTLLEWDNARLALRRAQVSKIQAELDLLVAQALFHKAIGE
jgi:outer membrane protein TolC